MENTIRRVFYTFLSSLFAALHVILINGMKETPSSLPSISSVPPLKRLAFYNFINHYLEGTLPERHRGKTLREIGIYNLNADLRDKEKTVAYLKKLLDSKKPLLRRIHSLTLNTNLLAISRDSQYLAVEHTSHYSETPSVFLVSLDNFRHRELPFYSKLLTFNTPKGMLAGIDYSKKHCLNLWNLETLEHRVLPITLSLSTIITALAFSENGSHMAVGTNRGTIQLWNSNSIEDLRCVIRIHLKNRFIRTLSFKEPYLFAQHSDSEKFKAPLTISKIPLKATSLPVVTKEEESFPRNIISLIRKNAVTPETFLYHPTLYKSSEHGPIPPKIRGRIVTNNSTAIFEGKFFYKEGWEDAAYLFIASRPFSNYDYRLPDALLFSESPAFTKATNNYFRNNDNFCDLVHWVGYAREKALAELSSVPSLKRELSLSPSSHKKLKLDKAD